jgi:hypothetical protein
MRTNRRNTREDLKKNLPTGKVAAMRFIVDTN